MALMITKMLVAIALAVLIARPSFAQQNFLSGQTPPGVDRRLSLGAVGNSQCGAEQARFLAPDGVYWRTPAWVRRTRAPYRCRAAGRTRQRA